MDTALGAEAIEMGDGAKGTLPADLVFHTHLHFGHVGWNMDGASPRFANVRYAVSQAV